MKPYSNGATSVGRRLALVASVTLAAISRVGHPHSAQAQAAVHCENCSTVWNQLLEYGKQLQQLATQLQSYETQLQQYANMVTNTLALPQQLWGQVQSDIMQVRNLSNAASLLSGNAGSIVVRLQSASAYTGQVASLGNIPGQFTTWQQTIGNSVATLGKTLGLQQDQQASDADLLAALEQHSQSAAGQMQAIQAGNELAHATVAQLQEIQATLNVTAQTQATKMAVDADRRALQDAAMLHFSTPAPIQTSGYQQY
jgi:type IV secretion system protein TrbJ